MYKGNDLNKKEFAEFFKNIGKLAEELDKAFEEYNRKPDADTKNKEKNPLRLFYKDEILSVYEDERLVPRAVSVTSGEDREGGLDPLVNVHISAGIAPQDLMHVATRLFAYALAKCFGTDKDPQENVKDATIYAADAICEYSKRQCEQVLAEIGKQKTGEQEENEKTGVCSYNRYTLHRILDDGIEIAWVEKKNLDEDLSRAIAYAFVNECLSSYDCIVLSEKDEDLLVGLLQGLIESFVATKVELEGADIEEEYEEETEEEEEE